MNLGNMRYRNGGAAKTLWIHQGYSSTKQTDEDASEPGSISFPEVPIYSYSREMWDVVVKDYRKRSAKGEIFNNPKHSVETTYSQNKAVLSGTTYYHGRSDGSFWYKYPVNRPIVDSEDACISRRTLFHPSRIEDVAITAAYAGVTANTQNAVLWAGEAKETVKMVSDIGAGLLALYKRTAKQRKAWAQGKLTIPEAQSLTLGLLYGILPLEQSIAQVTEGLFKLKSNGRETSRGFQVYTDTNSDSWTGDVSTVPETKGRYDTTYTLQEKLSVSVRAGVLYDVDVDDFPSIAIIADPKQIAETAYALARLSFVIDWFINVGSTIMAWAPSTGTNVLSAWLTVTAEYKQEYEELIDIYPKSRSDRIGSGAASGTMTSRYTVKTVTRTPIDRSDLAIFPRLNINLNFSKLNSLVLLFADAKKKR